MKRLKQEPCHGGIARDAEYRALMAGRKNCRICVRQCEGQIKNGMQLGAELGIADPDVFSHWEQWLGNRSPEILIIWPGLGKRQLFRTFQRTRPKAQPDHQKPLQASGLRGGLCRRRSCAGRRFFPAPVFLTNSILCLKAGPKMDASIRDSWVDNCTHNHLVPLLQFLRPPIVVAMGQKAWRAARTAFKINADKGIKKAAGGCWSANGSLVFAVIHPGPQGKISRKMNEQEADWRRIGAARCEKGRQSFR